MGRVIPLSFFAAPATDLAPRLPGKLLCRRVGDTVISCRITETECYYGEEDTACHAHHGHTPRTDTLYLPGGYTYVYLCYGIHSLLNLVTGPEGHPEAVLIRGVEGAAGPGRVTKKLAVTCADNRLLLTPEAGIWLEEDDAPPPAVVARPRVGIDYADPADRERPWRFIVKE